MPGALLSPEGKRLDGRKAVVTGGSSGIGRAIALAFADEGADLLITYRRNAKGAREVVAAVEARGRKALALAVDLKERADVDRLVYEAFTGLGRVDVWVNNAGADILTGEGARVSDLEKLDAALDVDLRGTVLCCWQVAPRLRAQKAGVILNVSWDHVLVGGSGRQAEIYAAAKGGVLAFSKSLARSFAPEVRVNILAPGWIRTAFADGLPAASQERLAAQAPLGRWGTPEDVARAAVYLASDEAAFLTGTTLLVNGGAVM